jgi:hypothetical protein
MATHWTLGCDAADPHRLAAFWALALGYVDEPDYDDPDGASIIDPDGKGPAIGFLRVAEPKTAKNRMHIDIRVAGEPPWDMAKREKLIRAKVTELAAAGATATREESYGEDLGHIVMHDPAPIWTAEVIRPEARPCWCSGRSRTAAMFRLGKDSPLPMPWMSRAGSNTVR